jgi:hypothetical protein
MPSVAERTIDMILYNVYISYIGHLPVPE